MKTQNSIARELVTQARDSSPSQTSWKQEFARCISDPSELSQILELDSAQSADLIAACQHFPLRVPRPYLARMTKHNLQDPLLLQVLPQAQELLPHSDFSADPLHEKEFSPLKGLLHKYPSRVLIVLNGTCAVHCRYCFRRHFPYQEHRIDRHQWQSILEYIRNDGSIEEVILSGGDPLSCSDESLASRIAQLSEIAHVMRLRIHTRLPIMIPQRISAPLIKILSGSRLQCIMVVHCNHAQEINAQVADKLQQLYAAGVILLNQSVLLKDINASPTTLAQLSKRLFACHTLPYYLHLLDKVQGAQHFFIDQQTALNIHRQLQAQVSGYLVPKLVTEQAHQLHKTLLS